MTPALPEALLHLQWRRLPLARTPVLAANDSPQQTRHITLKAVRAACMLASDFAQLRQAALAPSEPGQKAPLTTATARTHARLQVRYDVVGHAMLPNLPVLPRLGAVPAPSLAPSGLETALARTA